MAFLAASTDGNDGPTDAAGAFASPEVLGEARRAGLSPTDYLARNDSYRFFARIGRLYKTGPQHQRLRPAHGPDTLIPARSARAPLARPAESLADVQRGLARHAIHLGESGPIAHGRPNGLHGPGSDIPGYPDSLRDREQMLLGRVSAYQNTGQAVGENKGALGNGCSGNKEGPPPTSRTKSMSDHPRQDTAKSASVRKKGPNTFEWIPDPKTAEQMRKDGRDPKSFLAHGDSISSPGEASHGCLVLPPNIRSRLKEGVWIRAEEENGAMAWQSRAKHHLFPENAASWNKGQAQQTNTWPQALRANHSGEATGGSFVAAL